MKTIVITLTEADGAVSAILDYDGHAAPLIEGADWLQGLDAAGVAVENLRKAVHRIIGMAVGPTLEERMRRLRAGLGLA
jgi:hypothetical protein